MQSDRDLIDKFIDATRHLGLREAAELVGKSHQTVARWKRGKARTLTSDSRRAIERALARRELAQTRAEAGQVAPLFVVANHHTADCGTPPAIDGDTPDRYHSYFENEFGEQAVFSYEYKERRGILRMGDAGWEREYPVEDGFVELILSRPESLWLVASWAAATRSSAVEVMQRRDQRAAAWVEALDEKMEAMASGMNDYHSRGSGRRPHNNYERPRRFHVWYEERRPDPTNPVRSAYMDTGEVEKVATAPMEWSTNAQGAVALAWINEQFPPKREEEDGAVWLRREVVEVECTCGTWVMCSDVQNTCPSCGKKYGMGGGLQK